MRKTKLTNIGLFLMLLVFPISLRAQSTTKSELVEPKINGGIAAMFTLDPLTQTLCFGDGKEGHVFQNHQVKNRCSDIDFGTYTPGSFSVGIEGGRIGTIVNLGNDAELKQRYGYEETVGAGQGFSSLRIENGDVVILKEYRTQAMQQLKESRDLFSEGKSGASVPIKLGNIYLVRITDSNDKNFSRTIKFKVLSYTPNESVTIRWQTI